MTRLLIGIDGGGTKTHAWLADESGQVLGRGAGAASNAKTVGAVAARKALNDAIAGAFAAASVEKQPVAVACLGLAGFDRPEDRHQLELWSAEDDWAERLKLVNDGELLLAGGTPEGFGVGLIAGTGSIAVGQARDGRTSRSGGWGPIYSDEGSAYEIARAGLRLAVRRYDGREGPGRSGGALAASLCQAIGVDDAGGFVTVLYSNRFDRAAIAGLAVAVVAAADEDREVVSRILRPAGRELGEMVRAVAVALQWDEPTLPLAKGGGFLLGCRQIGEAVRDYLTDEVGYTLVETDVPEPVAGAIVLARRAIGR